MSEDQESEMVFVQHFSGETSRRVRVYVKTLFTEESHPEQVVKDVISPYERAAKQNKHF